MNSKKNVFVSGLLVILLLTMTSCTNNDKEPVVPEKERFNVSMLRTEKLESDYDEVVVTSVADNKLYVVGNTNIMGQGPLSFRTRSLGYYDLNDFSYHELMIFEDEATRVYDYRVFGDKLIYVEVFSSEDPEGLKYRVVQKEGNNQNLLAEDSFDWNEEIPNLVDKDDELYFLSRNDTNQRCLFIYTPASEKNEIKECKASSFLESEGSQYTPINRITNSNEGITYISYKGDWMSDNLEDINSYTNYYSFDRSTLSVEMYESMQVTDAIVLGNNTLYTYANSEYDKEKANQPESALKSKILNNTTKESVDFKGTFYRKFVNDDNILYYTSDGVRVNYFDDESIYNPELEYLISGDSSFYWTDVFGNDGKVYVVGLKNGESHDEVHIVEYELKEEK